MKKFDNYPQVLYRMESKSYFFHSASVTRSMGIYSFCGMRTSARTATANFLISLIIKFLVPSAEKAVASK